LQNVLTSHPSWSILIVRNEGPMLTKEQKKTILTSKVKEMDLDKKDTKNMKRALDLAYTVGDLIKVLETMPQDAPIEINVPTVIDTDGCTTCEMSFVIDVSEVSNGKTTYVELCAPVFTVLVDYVNQFELELEESMSKVLHKSDRIDYQYDQVTYPIDYKNLSLTPKGAQVHASPGVTWQDIANELSTFSGNGGEVLSTCLSDYPDLLLTMTLHTARELIRARTEEACRFHGKCSSEYPYVYLRKVDNFAKEMIQNRDWRIYCEEVPEKIREKSKYDFLPKQFLVY
jgi:hypothetical protein